MISLPNSELEAIYAASLGSGIRSLAITSSNPGEGVSSLAVALTQRHLLAGKSTLFVDMNCDKADHEALLTISKIDKKSADEPQLVGDSNSRYVLLGIPVPGKNNHQLKWRDPGVIEHHLSGWLEQFDAVVIDAGAVKKRQDTLIPTERIIASCESTLLVVLAGHTTTPMVQHSCKRIQQAGGHLCGCILNNLLNPSLKQELLRKTQQLPAVLTPIKHKLTNWFQQNRLLSLDV